MISIFVRSYYTVSFLFLNMAASAVILLLLFIGLVSLCMVGLLPVPILSLFATALQYIKGTGPFTPESKRRFDYNEVSENVIVGRQPRHANDLRKLVEENNVTAIVSLNEEKELYVKSNSDTMKSFKLKRLHIPTPDYQGPTVEQLHEAVGFIGECVDEGGTVYIHCHGGKGRSAAVAAAYILHSNPGINNFVEAVKTVQKSRSTTSTGLLRYPISSQSRSLHSYQAFLTKVGNKRNKKQKHIKIH